MPKLIKPTTSSETDFLPNVLRIAAIASDQRALDIRAYDMRDVTPLADCFILCSATSEPHFRAIFNGIREGMKEIGVAPMSSEGEFCGQWLLLDYSTIIVHIFREAARAFYDLDGFWGDAPRIELDLDAPLPKGL